MNFFAWYDRVLSDITEIVFLQPAAGGVRRTLPATNGRGYNEDLGINNTLAFTLKYPISVIERLFPSILCRTQSPSIHLTFDDGPHPAATPAVLDILRQYGIKAAFFLNGEHIERYS